MIYTYQDLLKVGTDENKRMEFVLAAIQSHKDSDFYQKAAVAVQYDCRHNVTIENFQKLLYTISGTAVPDNFSANYKLRSNFFNRFVVQQNQFLLGNGISLSNDADKAKLGDDFDMRLNDMGHNALVEGVSFGFWNRDHLEVFRLMEFCPLWDEETGGLAAGIRFWQIDANKPLRATLYEIDGYTEYIWRDWKSEVYRPKRKYVLNVAQAPVGDFEIIDGRNYPSFPIVPMWGNPARQSEFEGIREQIDCYDLIRSGLANTIDDASIIYWTLENAGGMDDIDLARFVERMRTVKAAVMDDDGAKATAHTMDVPYQASEALLEQLRNDLYDDYMALDTKNIAGGAATATQIKAAYEPINNKADRYECCVLDFLHNLFEIVGIQSEVSFTRSIMVNATENIQVLLQAAQVLPEEYLVRKILETLGDSDKADDVLEQIAEETVNRLGDIDGAEENI